ncbi:APC family permease [Pseudonocardia spinosispora]|uniref:APC family permease n=1 Tax=Pseudonocardia spinosispora TaxID=103441 RepID=UPI0003F88287|nr:APC family permease [Pseudonocardia spinosispora]
MSQPTLDRSLTLRSIVLFGLAYMAPMIVLGTFGAIAEETKGSVPSAYLLALVAMLFTAYSYGRMAATYPVAGSAYTYVRRTIDSRVGFLIGWATLLDYFFLPMVIWLIGGTYLQQGFPGVPLWLWVVGFIVLTTILNVIGIKVADRANFLLMTFQLLVVVAFVVLSLRHVFVASGSVGSWFSAEPFANPATTFAAIAGGAGIAAYSFLGFDAVTTLTEETINPKRTMPRAILLVALLGGAIFAIVTYATQLVHPGFQFADVDSAAFEIARTIGADLFAAIFLAGFVVTQFASGIAAQASVSRLLYAMGRDEVLPRKVFAYLQPKFRTPAVGIAICGVAGLIGLALDVNTAVSLINFGAFLAFTSVNVCVIALYLRRRGAEERRGVFGYLVLPLIGAVIDLYLLFNLSGLALTLGVCWLALGFVYLLFLTRGFRRPPPEIDPLSAEKEVSTA